MESIYNNALVVVLDNMHYHCPWHSCNSLPGTTKEVVRFEHPATRNDDDIRQRSPTRFALFTTPTFTTLVPPVAYVYSWQWRFASPLAGMQLHFAPTTVAMYTSRLYCEQKSFSMACILGRLNDPGTQEQDNAMLGSANSNNRQSTFILVAVWAVGIARCYTRVL